MDTPRTEQSGLTAEIESQETTTNNWTELDAKVDALVYKCPLSTRQQRNVAELADRLYNYMPPVCWMTEANLAAALNVSRRQLRYAKQHLVETGRVKIEERPNGKRANPVHTLTKVNPINQYVRDDTLGERTYRLDWPLFDNFAAKDLNNMSVNDLLEFYAEIGFQTIPLHYPKFKRELAYCSCKSGRNCPSIGKHPVVAYSSLDFSDARTYKEIQSYWEHDVNYNIGFKVEGFIVIDIDYREGGQYSFGYLQEELGEIPVGLSVLTGNGRHIYALTNSVFPNSVEVMGWGGIDIKSSGGIVVAPPSVHASENQYQWETIGQPEMLPETWAAFLQGEEVRPARGRKPRRAGAQPNVLLPTTPDASYVIPEGKRNRTLFGFASRERGKGANFNHILDVLTTLNERYCEPMVTGAELKTIAQSAMRYPSNAENRQQGLYNG